jgi:hypothetical protein
MGAIENKELAKKSGITQMVKLQESESVHRSRYQTLEGFIPRFVMALRATGTSRGEVGLGGAKDDQADFRRDAQPYWCADRSQASVHVNVRQGSRS